MAERERWLDALWPFVRSWLPTAPARVVEIGCGSLGGFVPRLEQAGWLHGQRAEWRESGLAWEDWLRSWAQAEKLHTGQDILNRLGERFDRETLSYGPYFFADLAATSEADEQAAIDAGLIQANRILYAGRRGDP